MNSKTSELKELLDLFDREGLVVAYLEADYFGHTFTISLYPEKITSVEEFIECIKDNPSYPLSANLTKAIENSGYKVIFYTIKHTSDDNRNMGFFLLSIEKTPGES
jgi:hypothetical protein